MDKNYKILPLILNEIIWGKIKAIKNAAVR
jgi:hypothetical protein